MLPQNAQPNSWVALRFCKKNNYGFSANLENFSMGACLIRGKPNESIFDVLALSVFSSTNVVAAPALSIGERVSTFLDEVKSEKTYVHVSQLVFDKDDVYFLSEAGALESVSLVGRDQNGWYISNFNPRGPKWCSACDHLLYDGNCTNPQCERYFLNQ